MQVPEAMPNTPSCSLSTEKMACMLPARGLGALQMCGQAKYQVHVVARLSRYCLGGVANSGHFLPVTTTSSSNPSSVLTVPRPIVFRMLFVVLVSDAFDPVMPPV